MSSYAVPSYSPVQVIGLPGSQSVDTSAPNMNRRICAGSVSTAQTRSGEAVISVSAVATNPVMALNSFGLPSPPYDRAVGDVLDKGATCRQVYSYSGTAKPASNRAIPASVRCQPRCS